MTYLLLLIPPVIALIALIIAIRRNFHKQAFFISVAVTLVVVSLVMEHLTMYGLLCATTILAAVLYIGLCFFLSISERKNQ